MKFSQICFVLLIVSFSISASGNYPFELTYIHPRPNSAEISVNSKLILKIDKALYHNFPLDKFSISILGSKSGVINCTSIVSDNTIALSPQNSFEPNETISVSIFSEGEKFEYSFRTTDITEYDKSVFELSREEDEIATTNRTERGRERPTIINGVSVPSDFPLFEPTIFNPEKVAPGKIFINNWLGNPYIAILENDGTPYFYQKVEDRSRDFKVQENGKLTRRIRNSEYGFVGMDSSYNIVDYYKCTNGYETDEHEMYMTEDGHYFLIALGYRNVNMSQIIPGGNTNATVIDNHIQEFDENHNLVFEWLSFDYFDVEDAIHENLHANTIDYVHMNSIAVDYDGNIIISSRHLDEVTKINRETGEIIWRLGGVNNQFQFTNDNDKLAYQHHARPVKGTPGNYTIFDNGNHRFPEYSRAVEFSLNTTEMTAERVWQFRHQPEIYTWWMGNAQRLSNGNTFINYANGDFPKAVEVTPTGEVVYEGDFLEYYHCYRAFRFEWKSEDDKPYLVAEPLPDNVSLLHNHFGKEDVAGYILYKGSSPEQLVPFDTVSTTLTKLTDLVNNSTYFFAVRSVSQSGELSELSNIEEVYVNIVPAGTNYVRNYDFSQGENEWIFGTFEQANATGSVNGVQEYAININNGGTADWHVQLTQENIPLIKGRKYKFSFDTRSVQDRTISARLEKNGDPYTNYSKTGTIIIKRQMRTYKFEFEMTEETDYNARITFNFGNSEHDVFIDDVSMTQIPITSSEQEYIAPENFKLLGNYPNPFNPSTVIKFNTPGSGHIILKIYSSIGEEIDSRNLEVFHPGEHNFTYTAKSLSSGVYLYTIQYSGENFALSKSGKMILLK